MTSSLLSLLGAVLSLLALLVTLPAVVLLVQVLASLRAPRRPVAPAAGRFRVGVLMPAHNESLGIAPAIASVRAQLAPGDRLLVVADNCDDDTAAVAMAAGAEVVERRDPGRRGKGYALDHGMRHYELAPVDIVVIVDADCRLHPGALRAVAETAAASGRPAQALYLMRSPAGSGVKTRVAEFAWRVRNQVRPLGCLAVGAPCQLMGTGMAFPWAIIAKAPLASGHLVEDMELGLALAAQGRPPLFCPSALVTSEFAQDDRGSRSQRTRWEHGHLGMIVSRGLPVLWRGAVRGQPALVAMALDMCVPPLASLVLVQGALTLVVGGWALTTSSVMPFWLAAAGSGATALAIAVAWRHYARDVLTPAELASIPGYVFGKLPIYLTWFTRRQTEWVRTRRGGSSKK